MIVTLAGHVDHGKTSIVRALTGTDTDRLAEEKRRGLTIDLGFAYADIAGHRVGFVDVPGHHRFIHNMVAGIAGQQFALLVVAADDGVMPQSKEHLQILRLLGLSRGLVALNKVDRVAAERVGEVQDQIRGLTADSFLDGAPIIELSCETAVGFDTLRKHLGVAAAREADRDPGAPFRLAIDRAFTIRGSGVVVTGTVASGRTSVGDRLVLASTGHAARVRSLHVQDEAANQATVGDRAAVNLAGVAADDVKRGDWLLDPPIRDPQTDFVAALTVVDDFPRAAKHNVPVHTYHATSHAQGRLLLLDGAPVAPPPRRHRPGGRTVPVATAREDRRPRGVSRPRPRPHPRRRSRRRSRGAAHPTPQRETTRAPARHRPRRSGQLAGALSRLGTSLRRGIRPCLEPIEGRGGGTGPATGT